MIPERQLATIGHQEATITELQGECENLRMMIRENKDTKAQLDKLNKVLTKYVSLQLLLSSGMLVLLNYPTIRNLTKFILNLPCFNINYDLCFNVSTVELEHFGASTIHKPES